MDLEKILEEAKIRIKKCNDLNILLHEVKSYIFGKNSELTKIFSKMKDLCQEEKKELGKHINIIKIEIEKELDKRRKELELIDLEKKLKNDELDGTLSFRKTSEGSIHIITKTEAELCEIFTKYGFKFVDGLEIEDDYYNFTALNVKKNHPARQMQDTFYLQGKNDNDMNYILRTHTTCVDAREVIENNLKPPIALISCGKTFRCDSDRTHSPMFHQFEGLMIDKDLNLGNLKFFLEKMLSEFFETDDICIRMRPSYFPFTEPSVEVDIGYCIDGGEIKIGGNKSWLEVLGAGMLHPNVLKNLNIDSDEYSAIAFGCGVERFAMLKYGANDIRQFTASKINWLKHYSFGSYDI
jgi:phenylalanyl-tRNA synthetase alpha chain